MIRSLPHRLLLPLSVPLMMTGRDGDGGGSLAISFILSSLSWTALTIIIIIIIGVMMSSGLILHK